ncbi:head-tail connector protein [Sphingomonas sp. BAUL-RG-20F-R05-02]|uniref:head-tail connector protein n=1 Tax=Sphingomonas sp. BAUL-RG-20F-R05-02 TaxID=2914830 RepID=UPI001F5853D1|nr:head-tail connector protein [Sphingomonas sp. BAUL-RG-20F-R05-02]
MRVVVITPPEPVITREQAKAHLNVDHDDDDTLIDIYVAAATGQIDGPDGWLGRSLGRQTLEARFDTIATDWCDLPLPCAPVAELVSISWTGADHQPRVADLTTIDLIGNSICVSGLAPWNDVRVGREVLKVRYVAGYETLPAAIVAAILLMVGDLYRFRETASDQGVTPIAIPMSTTVTNLLTPFRLYG